MKNNTSKSGETIEQYTASGQLSLKYRLWVPVDSPQGIAVVLHGIQSHSGWYTACGSHLASQGFATAAVDRRGSGLNSHQRGHTDSFKTLVEDIRLAVATLKERYPPVPVHLVGISWGAKTAAAFAIMYPDQVQSLIFSGPGFKPVCDFPLKRKLRIGLGAFLNPKGELPIPIGQGGMFTNTRRWIDFIDNDPLTLRRATFGFYYESKRLDLFLARHWSKLTVPCQLMIGTEDRIMNVKRTISFFGKLPNPSNRIVEYKKSSHTLEFESDPSVYFGDMGRWLGQNKP